jgi:histidine triad (HIT) family protein
METIFTKIIKREIPAEIIYEDEFSLVIPDKFPSMPGQLVVITKRQAPYIFDLTDDEYSGLMKTVKKVAGVLDRTLGTKRTCIIVEGFEVPHVHVRMYPCTDENLVTEPRSEVDEESLKILADNVRKYL